jgi:8-oxo-dGTP pyrophosphatase MutT (NUDIX family)
VNVLVHQNGSNKYALFEQSKYGLDGPRLAVVGGFIDSSDASAEDAARRELLEEMGLIPQKMVGTGCV